MSDWAVGDLALCIESGTQTREGVIYTVVGVVPAGVDFPCDCHRNYGPDDNLFLAGIHYESCGQSSGADRFRKIRPDEREACEPEFVTLLQRIKRKEVA
jgi:hypothetical protein